MKTSLLCNELRKNGPVETCNNFRNNFVEGIIKRDGKISLEGGWIELFWNERNEGGFNTNSHLVTLKNIFHHLIEIIIYYMPTGTIKT